MEIDLSKRVYIIAEAGVNHNGSLEMAKELVDAAVEVKADAIKFQSFVPSEMITSSALKAKYQLDTTDQDESQIEMLKRLQLSFSEQTELASYAKKRKITYLSTPFDSMSLDLLINNIGLKSIKVSSGDITNAPLLLATAQHAEQVILSTGMSTLAEIEEALGVLAFGFSQPSDVNPSRKHFIEAYVSESGLFALSKRVILLHCTTEYPAPYAEVNLNALSTLASAFNLPVGYSDHTRGDHVAVAAVAKGAKLIEKHFTLNSNFSGPDHSASLELEAFRSMVNKIREIEMALGDGIKRPMKSELANRSVVRKSLVASKSIKKGEYLELSCKRADLGLSPFEYWDRLKCKANQDYELNEIIRA